MREGTTKLETRNSGHTVLRDLLEWRQRGIASALVTLINVEGSAPQPVGSQMAVNANGDWVGRITSGCAEAAIAVDAVRAINEQETRTERYGAGSKYLDISLPCGSGIDVFFDPHIPTTVIEELLRGISERRPLGLTFQTQQNAAGHYDIRPLEVTKPQQEFNLLREQNARADMFTKMFFPNIRLNIAGRGPILSALARIAQVLKWDIVLSSPDDDLLRTLHPLATKADHLTSPQSFSTNVFDGWTASVLLFHEHEWEPEILMGVLAAENFYIGALGSRRAHQARKEALAELGCNERQIDKIRGPIGLDIGAQTSEEIAVAIIGEILATARGDRWADSQP